MERNNHICCVTRSGMSHVAPSVSSIMSVSLKNCNNSRSSSDTKSSTLVQPMSACSLTQMFLQEDRYRQLRFLAQKYMNKCSHPLLALPSRSSAPVSSSMEETMSICIFYCNNHWDITPGVVPKSVLVLSDTSSNGVFHWFYGRCQELSQRVLYSHRVALANTASRICFF